MSADDQLEAHDQDVLDLLRAALAALPADVASDGDDAEPPAAVLSGALWVHDWLNMEAELAELTFDSTEDRELAGVRSMGALRELTFVSGDYTIEIEIEPGARTVEVSGTIAPLVAGRLQLVVGGEIYAGPIDDRGAFVVTAVPHGTVLALVDTTHGKIRLGSFEV
ncbi:MAG TPA: hypothetical protein VNQ73_11895 [Ilumatobacter sp.]|nr:hypothetical protein [Ilumatobacter sp.]